MKKTLDIVNNAINNFKIEGKSQGAIPYGNGHINDTFYVSCFKDDGCEKKYILQAINKNVFNEPEKVMENIKKVTDFLSKNARSSREVMSVIPTYNNNSFYKDKYGYYWRMYDFVVDSICIDRPETEDDFYQSAFAFGKFQHDLNDFPANSLNETIKNFHNTEDRYKNFLNAVNNDLCGRAKNVLEEIEYVKSNSDFYGVINNNYSKGNIPLRVSHNDTKMNNVLLDSKTRKALCVIDLDTIMPGFSVTDFGDAIRFGASTAAEDEKDLSKVNFDIDLFKIYTKGYIDGCCGNITDNEIMLLPEGAKLMTLECGMRFLTDYLQGDTYFKTKYKEHNLVRSRTQFKLAKEMDKNWDILKNIVSVYCKKH